MGLMNGIGIGFAVVSGAMIVNGRGNELVDFGQKAIGSIVDLVNSLLYKGGQIMKNNDRRQEEEPTAKEEQSNEQIEDQSQNTEEMEKGSNTQEVISNDPEYTDERSQRSDPNETKENEMGDRTQKKQTGENELTTSGQNQDTSITDKKIKTSNMMEPGQNGKVDSVEQAVYNTNGIEQNVSDVGVKAIQQNMDMSRF
jgi:4-diphosphocytidyl-2C-methyl-D-erythritol kinase